MSIDLDKRSELTDAVLLELAEQLYACYPDACYVLFGSRASGKAKPYSDIDLGAFAPQPITLATHVKLLNITESFEDATPWRVDLVNLSRADAEFLRSIAPHVRYLAGREEDFNTLMKRCRGEHE